MTEETTTMSIRISNKERLMALGKMGDSLDDVLTRLLDLIEEKKMEELINQN